MKCILIISLTLLGLSFSCFSMYEDPLLIAANRTATSEIVIPRDASSQLKEVSVFLQRYIEKSTGAKLPVVNEPTGDQVAIHVGNTSLVSSRKVEISSKNEEAFIIDILDDNDIILLGNSDWGTE